MNHLKRVWCRILWHDWIFRPGWASGHCRRCHQWITDPVQVHEAFAEVLVTDRTRPCTVVGHQWEPIHPPDTPTGPYGPECVRCGALPEVSDGAA